jgi:hypothetical protein
MLLIARIYLYVRQALFIMALMFTLRLKAQAEGEDVFGMYIEFNAPLLTCAY